MLGRKIYAQIERFYKENSHKALMITGARQVGKTFIIEKYIKEHYAHYIKLDFIGIHGLVALNTKSRPQPDSTFRHNTKKSKGRFFDISNQNLHAAKTAKNDEFYTRLEDIENETSMCSDYLHVLCLRIYNHDHSLGA